jgi:hypothetical protein
MDTQLTIEQIQLALYNSNILALKQKLINK